MKALVPSLLYAGWLNIPLHGKWYSTLSTNQINGRQQPIKWGKVPLPNPTTQSSWMMKYGMPNVHANGWKGWKWCSSRTKLLRGKNYCNSPPKQSSSQANTGGKQAVTCNNNLPINQVSQESRYEANKQPTYQVMNRPSNSNKQNNQPANRATDLTSRKLMWQSPRGSQTK